MATLNANQTIIETKKMLRLIRKEVSEMRLVAHNQFLVLIVVQGSIEIKDASQGFSARVAGQVVERLQMLHDSINAKITLA